MIILNIRENRKLVEQKRSRKKDNPLSMDAYIYMLTYAAWKSGRKTFLSRDSNVDERVISVRVSLCAYEKE